MNKPIYFSSHHCLRIVIFSSMQMVLIEKAMCLKSKPRGHENVSSILYLTTKVFITILTFMYNHCVSINYHGELNLICIFAMITLHSHSLLLLFRRRGQSVVVVFCYGDIILFRTSLRFLCITLSTDFVLLLFEKWSSDGGC